MSAAISDLLTFISFAALIICCIGCAICAGWMLMMSRLGRDLDRESEHGFRLPESRADKQAKREGGR